MSSNKSFSLETSERYARALYELTFDSNELKIVEKKVEEFLELYEKNNEFKNFFKDPTQSQSVQLNIMESISALLGLPKILKNFLSILVTKRRIFFISKIFKSFLSIVFKKSGLIKASLVSSKKLTNSELENLNKEISKIVGAKIAFDYKVNENLIGGLTMQLESLMIDTSIKSKLKKYEQIMSEA